MENQNQSYKNQAKMHAGEPPLEVPFWEKLKGIPGIFGIRLEEKPSYKVLSHEGHKEVRQYRNILIAKTTMQGSYEDAMREGFSRLARYIFGYNQSKKNLSMTAPVLEEHEKLQMTSPVLQEKEAKGWTMSFVLPSDQTLAKAPRPNDQRVHLISITAQKWAVLRYSGKPDEIKMHEKAYELEIWLKTQKNLRVISSPRWAQYDAPFSIPFLRRNEVQIQVEMAH